MDILTFQFAMEHINNAYNMFYPAFLFHLLSSVHMFKCSMDSLIGRYYHGYFTGYILEYSLLEYEQLDYIHSARYQFGQVVATCKMYTIADNHLICGPYKLQYMIQH